MLFANQSPANQSVFMPIGIHSSVVIGKNVLAVASMERNCEVFASLCKSLKCQDRFINFYTRFSTLK
ncbi:hypothetical protein CU100_21550 [Phyllobacterium endophyticum]|uniref:Uncharacterized protein n=1 Tax=Phyllobacterium endophyticum TaxID=1149773 RepID=A0A2P7APN7_9HYPH|nr:hypothetical protein CU100_21550 [Phyllobacterium endophyticum]